ncbi:MAG: phosphomannomutase/phosphoglucomutase [Patescibacteria group bacterium]|nr:phosphomannomutase/phosphoglucomutase [Patescibacteria group bacterium]
MLNPNIFREYDIRGIVNKDFEPKDARKIGKAFGTIIQEISGKNLIIGHDNRFTSDSISAYFIDGVLSTGCNVIDCGLALRPVIQTAILEDGFSGGALITGSHNPPAYNGIKFMTQEGLPVFGDSIIKIKDLCFSKKFKKGSGNVEHTDLKELYLKKITPKFNLGKGARVVIDCGNGTASKYAPSIFRALGIKVISLYCNLHGSYPYHTPNPEARVNTLDLSQKVKETEADVGLAFDTDGDRFGIVDEEGNHHENDRTLVLLAKHVLEKNPGAKILYDIKSSQILRTEIRKAGGVPIMMRTGHPFFQARMKKDPEILLGGELSGHTMYRENNCFDDGIYAAAKLVELATHTNPPLSKTYEKLPKTFNTPEIKVPCPDQKKFNIVQEMKEMYKSHYDIFEADGLRILFSKSCWALIRASHTTPALSLRFEANDKKELKKLIEDVKKNLEKYPELGLDQVNLFIEAGK